MITSYEFTTKEVKDIVDAWGSSGEGTQARYLIDLFNSLNPDDIDFASITIKVKKNNLHPVPDGWDKV